MPLNKAYEGKQYPPTDPIPITAESIHEFAEAIGDSNPLYREEAAARAAGYAGVIAPPTYLTKLNFIYSPQIILDEGLGLNYSMVVHGQQHFELTRPIVAGDALIAKPRIASISSKGRNEFLVTEATIETSAGELVAVARSTIVSRGTAEEETGA